MSTSVEMVAEMIRAMTLHERAQLAAILGNDEGTAGVAVALPTDPPPKEGGAEVPFEDWPADYFENME